MSSVTNRLGLGLSGGGYRATAFHLGTLKKLEEMKILQKIGVMSTISGGSITGAAWGLHEGDYDSFHNEMIEKLRTKSVIGYIFQSRIIILGLFLIALFLFGSIYLSFTEWSCFSFLLFGIMLFLLLKFQFKILPIGDAVEKAYKKIFFGERTLGNLRKDIVIAIGSSNLETGRPFTFSRIKMSDSTYTGGQYKKNPVLFTNEYFPVARAVLASSCVPFAFTPVYIAKEFYKTPDDCDRVLPVLVDGGVYDNQGIQKLTQSNSIYECGIIIISDAGGGFMADKKYPNTIALLIRTVDLFMYRIKTSQMVQNIYKNVNGSEKPIAYFSLGWTIDKLIPGFIDNMEKGQILSSVIEAHKFKEDWKKHPKEYEAQITAYLKDKIDYGVVEKRNLTNAEWKIACKVSTNLTCLSGKQIDYLIRHAENMTELQVKLYCPSVICSN